MSEQMITCQLCGETAHLMQAHLKAKHEGVTLEAYQAAHPLAEIMSSKAKEAMEAHKTKSGLEGSFKAQVDAKAVPVKEKNFFHELFGFAATNKDALSARGAPIAVQVHERETKSEQMIPDKDPGYVYDANLTKTVMMGLIMNVPIYLWGHAGVGKTSLYEQVAAQTNWPYIRVQHSGNMEEADVEGRYIINAKGEMEFQYGPLVDAMLIGAIYCADEYDFASPTVLSIYQSVLEGKPLYLKACNRKIVAHPNFRFCGTGNTNGAGDETGLYQGTMLQNAANYERFGIVDRVNYMPNKAEVEMITGKSKVAKADAENIVKFATLMRDAYDKKEVSAPMSPRSTLNAAKLGVARADMRYGIKMAYINRLPETSAAVAAGAMQRIFG